MKYYRFIFIVLLLMIMCSISWAQIPNTLSYQGILTDSLGNPKPDGSYSLTFRLYDAEASGSVLWTEVKTLEIKRGLFTTVLGDQALFGAAVKFDKPYWLSIQVSSQPELSPRIPLSAVAYSLNSLKADTAQYARSAPSQSFVDSARIAGTVPDGIITSTKIQNSTIQFADIAQNGAASGQVMKWNGTAWAPATDATGGGSGGWSDNGTQVELATSSDTVNIGSSSPIGKLHVNGDIGLSSLSSIKFGNDANRITATSGDMRLVSEDLSMLTTGDITMGHYGDETWAKFDNTTKRFGIGTLSPVDRLHVENANATSCWLRVETSHPTNYGQAGLRLQTPQNMWNLRLDNYTNANFPTGALSLYSQDGAVEAMTWLENGRVGIGTTNPLKKLHVYGSALVKDTLFAGKIDPQLLSADQLPDEPGVVSHNLSNVVPLIDSWKPIDSVEISVPAAGYVIAFGSTSLYSDHTWLDDTEARIGLSTSRTGSGSMQWWRLPPDEMTAYYRASLSTHRVFTVAGASTYKFYITGVSYGLDAVNVQSSVLTVLYIPSYYGASSFAATEESDQFSDRSETPSSLKSVQSSVPQVRTPASPELDALRLQINNLVSEVTVLKRKLDEQKK